MKKTTMYLLLLFAMFAVLEGAPAQTTPPSTDVYLVELSARGGRLEFGAPVNVTKREGYDNQPSFEPAGQAILYTSIRGDKPADIYRYDPSSKVATRITDTLEAEYSPTVMPGGGFFSSVRVEADSTQRLWKFALDGGSPSLLLEQIKPVGYHAWIDADRVALFILGEPNSLQIADLRTGKAKTIMNNIGRSLQLRPGTRKLAFVHKAGESDWLINEVDADSGEVTRLVRTLPGSEDYAWTPSGRLLMAKGSKLFEWDPATGGDWREVADFAAAGLKDITRLAISPKGDRMALAAADAP